MKAATIIGLIVIVAILAGAGFFFFRQPANAPAASPTPTTVADTVPANGGNEFIQQAPDASSASTDAATEESATDAKTIAVDETGFAVKSLTIAAGTTVTFVNNGQGLHWPASDVHPVHAEYPGSNISKCGTAEASSIFDACHGLATGEKYSFTFNEVGTWGFHDHLAPAHTGTIIVQ